MRKRIVRVSPLQAGKVAAVLYGLISLPVVLIMLGAASMGGTPGISMGLIAMLPLFYVIAGFLFTLIGALVYNLVARLSGGFEFDVEEQA